LSRRTFSPPGNLPGAFLLLSSLLVLTGFHRVIYVWLGGLPGLLVAVVAGLTNLAWYEVAYLVGGGLKSVFVFLLIPLAGGATGLLSGLLVLTGSKWKEPVLRLHLFFSLTLGLLGLAVLLWRFVRGFEDPWRMAATIGFLMLYSVWLFFSYRRKPARLAGS
jgi:hypothetical protein